MRQLTDRLGLRGAATLLIADGVDSACTLSTLPMAARPGDAAGAARLAALSANAGLVETDPCAAALLWKDPHGSPGAGQHWLGIACPAQRLAEAEALRASGLNILGMAPCEALGSFAAAECLRELSASGKHAVTWIGTQSSVTAVGSAGALTGFRVTGLGLDAIAEAMTRPARGGPVGDREGLQAELSLAQARELLGLSGIPRADDEIAVVPGVRGAALLANLQPVLQRLSVDIKHTIRFAPGSVDMSGATLRVIGPGADVRGLEQSLASFAGVEPVANRAGPGLTIPREAPHAALRHFGRFPVLTTSSGRVQHGLRRARVGMLLGSACVMGVLAVDLAGIRAQTRALHAELATINHGAAGDENSSPDQAEVLRRHARAAAVHAALTRALGDRPDAGSVLKALAWAAPTGLRITELDLAADSTPVRLTLRAQVRDDEPADASQRIGAFIDSLSAIPLFGTVTLEASRRVSRASSERETTFEYELVADVVPLPASRLGAISEEAP